MIDINTAEKLAEEYRCAQLWARQHDKQIRFRSAQQRIRVAFGGNRTGKTITGAQESCRYFFNAHENRKIELPFDAWICCPSFELQKDGTQKALESMIPKHRIKHIDYVHSGIWKEVLLDNGVRFTFKSYEQGREKFQSAAKRFIWFDEEPPKDIWEEATMRVEAGVPLDIFLTMTPVNGMTWVYDDIYLATDNPDIFTIHYSWEDNPWLTKEQREQMARGLTAEALQMRKEGKFLQRVGLVNSWWDRDIHLHENIVRQSSWNIVKVIDFGWSSSKTSVIWYGIDSYDQVYAFHGIYENYLNDEDLAKQIKETEANMGFYCMASIADNQPDRIETLARNGVNCQAIDKSTTNEDWDTVKSEAMAKIGRIDPVSQRSKFHVSNTLTIFDDRSGKYINWFAKEVESLRWQERNVNGQSKEKAKWDKDNCPIKGAHYDAMDNYGYFAVWFTKRGEKHVEKKGNYTEKIPKPINYLSGI